MDQQPSYTIKEFCARWRISRSTYYEMRNLGGAAARDARDVEGVHHAASRKRMAAPVREARRRREGRAPAPARAQGRPNLAALPQARSKEGRVDGLAQAPACSSRRRAIPLLKDTDPAGFNDHVEDIRAHGLVELIVGWASKEGLLVLDGRNRLDALAHLGLLYETCDHHVGIKKWTGSEWSDQPGGRIDGHNGDAFRIIYEREGLDPYAIVISLNAHRRHLTPKLKRELIGNVLKAQTATSNRQIGIITKCDDKTVAKVRAELESTAEIP